MVACSVSGRRVKSSFNFNYNFFQRHCVIVKSQERCEIFSPKELPKEQDDLQKVQRQNVFHSDKKYC